MGLPMADWSHWRASQFFYMSLMVALNSAPIWEMGSWDSNRHHHRGFSNKNVILHALNRAELTQKLIHQQSLIDILLLSPYCWLIPLNPSNLRCFLKAERRSTKWFWLMKLDSLKEGFGFTECFLVRRSLQTGFGDMFAMFTFEMVWAQISWIFVP
jgi:hypothetical protein